jgi:putative ATP-dependent endonuclease of OLD family
MKLTEMQVKNFRSLCGENIKVSFTDSNVIFVLGQNNVGKSALLSAYEYLVTPKQKALLSDFHGYNESTPIEIIATFDKEESDEPDFTTKGLNKWVDGEGKIRFKKTWVCAGGECQKETFDLVKGEFIKDGFGGFDTHFTHRAPTPIRIPAIQSLKELSDWVKTTVKSTVLKQLHLEEQEHYQRIERDIQELQNKILGRDTVAALATQANRNFQQVFPALSLVVSLVEGSKVDITKSLEADFSVIIRDLNFPDTNQGFENHGNGVVRQAMFNFLGLVKNKIDLDGNSGKSYIILFEEPEIYLHPKAVKLLREVLYALGDNSPFQLLCASHSPTLIDISRKCTSLVRIGKNEDNTIFLHQAGDNLFQLDTEMKSRIQMANRFDPNVCEVFFSDEAILVEGDTEAVVCREVLAKHYPKKDIFVLNTGSKNNIPFFQTILSHFRIKHHIIHDSDTRYNYKISKDSEGDLIYEASFKQNGEQVKNSAWKLNADIWNLIESANSKGYKLASRYVSVFNFETANGYQPNMEKGKPLSAYEFAVDEERVNNSRIFKFLSYITGSEVCDEDFSIEALEAIITEPLFVNKPKIEKGLINPEVLFVKEEPSEISPSADLESFLDSLPEHDN